MIDSAKRVVVTAGQQFTDIDAFACAVVYAQYLRDQDVDAHAVLPGLLNASIPDQILDGLEFSTDSEQGPADSYVLVDISDPEYISSFANLQKVVELFDHHPGFVDYWKGLDLDHLQIEEVGSCATLIWESVREDHNMEADYAKVLYLAIVSNTLNFNAVITKDRDRDAAKEIAVAFGFGAADISEYYSQTEVQVFEDIEGAIKNDTKEMQLDCFGEIIAFGQLELLDGAGFERDHGNQAKSILATYGHEITLMSIVSIEEGVNYLLCDNERMRKALEKILGIKFEGGKATTSRLWMRKEILKELYEYEETP